MIKIRIALATAFVAASVLGASAQKSVQAEIEKAEKTCLSEAGCRTANCVGTVCTQNACNDSVCPIAVCPENVCANAECVNTECAKTECRKAKTKCRKKTECRKVKSECRKGKKGGKHHGHKKGGDLFAELNLTPEQQTQIDALFAKRKEQARADKAKNAEEKAARKAEKAEKKAAARQEFEAELQKILTPEQYNAFKAKRAERAKDMKSARPFGEHRKSKMAGKIGEKGQRCAKDSLKAGEVRKARAPKKI